MNDILQEISQFLLGKQLLVEDLSFPQEIIHKYVEKGYISKRKGITCMKNQCKCERCGNTDNRWFSAFPCARCQQMCTYCRKCIMMGRISACSYLYSWSGNECMKEEELIHGSTSTQYNLQWEGTLSKGQQDASEKVTEAILQNKELLVWAVCGAGKTEILFKGIEDGLKQQKRVCIATPRTDVVLELAPRLQAVFPHIKVVALYGGSDDRHIYSRLTITTTHQLLRFYKAFDTVILDEVDAFPYSVDEALQYAVGQARKQASSLVYLTATPNYKWQRECKLGKRDFVTIPARFHRHPLPVPKHVWCGNWSNSLKKDRLPSILVKWLKERLHQEKQALLFIPHVALIKKILPLLQVLHPKIEAVHAEDPMRKEKVQAMREKEIPFLVTTTILERGVTFPNIDVAVFGAEDRIFTESALVQISGRVGRSKLYPTGEIVFFHYGITEDMVKARKQIVEMNKEARAKGLIDIE